MAEAVADRDAASIEVEKLRSALERTVLDWKTRTAANESDLVGARERAALLLKDKEQREQSIKSLSHALDEASSKLESKERELSELKDRLTSSRDTAEAERRQAEARSGKEVEDLLQAQKTLQARLASKEETIRKLQRDLTDVQLRAENQHLELRRSSSRQLQEQNARLVECELEIARLKGSVSGGEAKVVQLQEQVEAAATVSNSEKALIRREKDIVSQKLTDASIEIKALKDELSQQEQRLMASSDLIREKDNEIARLKLTEGNLRAQIDRARADAADAELRGQRLVEAVRQETRERLAAVQDSIQGQLEAHLSKSDRALKRERQRSEAYKKKALVAYERYKAAVGRG